MASEFKPGQCVDVKYGGAWHSCRLNALDDNGYWTVQYRNGTTQMWVDPAILRVPKGGDYLQPGSHVIVRWHLMWYAAELVALDQDGYWEVIYSDGVRQKGIDEVNIAAAETSPDAAALYKFGMKRLEQSKTHAEVASHAEKMQALVQRHPHLVNEDGINAHHLDPIMEKKQNELSESEESEESSTSIRMLKNTVAATSGRLLFNSVVSSSLSTSDRGASEPDELLPPMLGAGKRRPLTFDGQARTVHLGSPTAAGHPLPTNDPPPAPLLRAGAKSVDSGTAPPIPSTSLLGSRVRSSGSVTDSGASFRSTGPLGPIPMLGPFRTRRSRAASDDETTSSQSGNSRKSSWLRLRMLGSSSSSASSALSNKRRTMF